MSPGFHQNPPAGTIVFKDGLMATVERRLAEILIRGDVMRRRGEIVSAEELCKDYPELLEEVRLRLQSAPLTGRWTDTSDLIPAVAPLVDDNLRAGHQLVPGYTLVQRLGRGGYGEVWKALAPGGFAVALKFVPLEAAHSQIEERSLDIIRTLRHPNLLTTVGSWRTAQYLVIAMELADGTLQDRFHEAVAEGDEGIPRAELLQYLSEAARGIDYLNGQQLQLDGSERPGVQHRDIKPENILIVGNGVKVADFGLARLLEGAQTGHTGNLTHIYAAPEFFKGLTTQQSDQYSLAITYCQLRAGRVPFSGSPAEVMYGHLTQAPDLTMLPLHERSVVAQALSKVPEQRWPNCIAFVDAIRESIDQAQPLRADQAASRGNSASHRMIGFAGLCLAALCPLIFIGLFVELTHPHWQPIRGSESNPLPRSEQAALATSQSGRTSDLDVQQASSVTKTQAIINRPQVPASPQIVSRTTGMKLALIPAGTFLMGSPDSETSRQADEGPQHTVTFNHSFFLGVCEVTQQEYAKVMGANPSYFSTSGKSEGNSVRGQETSTFPVEEVSWFDAIEFCNKLSELDGWAPRYRLDRIVRIDGSIHSADVTLVQGTGYRLPTEAEWEFACRANSDTPFHVGAQLNGDQANIDGSFPYGTARKGPMLGRTTPVSSYWNNAFGLYDMHGNVMEWCWDVYDETAYRNQERSIHSSVTSSSDLRVLRGGSWSDRATNARSARRFEMAPSSHYYTIGFRVAADANGE